MTELMVIAIIALLVVGPQRLPDLAKSLAKGLSEFKKAADDVSSTVRETIKPDEFADFYHYEDNKKTKDESPSPVAAVSAETSKQETNKENPS